MKQVEMKEKITKDKRGWTKNLLEDQFYRRYLMKGINLCIVPLVSYSGPFVGWTREELREMD